MIKSIFTILYLLILTSSTAQSVNIGSQIWSSKNLDVITFRNGDPIPYAESNQDWSNACRNGQPAWCYLNNDKTNNEKFGKLYNWFAVNDPRGLAPQGWHVPSIDEWNTLTKSTGGYNFAAKALKSSTGWESYKTGGDYFKTCSNCEAWSNEYRSKVPCHVCKDTRKVSVSRPVVIVSGNGTNSTGFSGFPAGIRYDNGNFGGITTLAIFWSTSQYDRESAKSYSFISNLDIVYDCSYNACAQDKTNGFSVRCLKGDVNLNSDQIDILINRLNDSYKRGDYINSIKNSILVINSGNAGEQVYNLVGWCYLLTKNYSKSISYLEEARRKFPLYLYIEGNLAHAYLLNGEFEKAKEIYLKFRSQKINNVEWKKMVSDDFNVFKGLNINSDKYNEILSLLN